MAHVADRVSSTEVLVVGAGLVGAAAAIALAEQGLQVTLVDNKPVEASVEMDGWDQRIYAISPGNRQWLDRLGIWAGVDHDRICDVDRMQVWGDTPQSLLEFDAYDANLLALSHILENHQLQQAMWRRVLQLPITVLAPVQVQVLRFSTGQASLELTDGTRLDAQLIVAADGGHSWVRQQAGLVVTGQAYEQMGVVANFECELPHRNTARQWFREDGVLAWLPMPGKRISIVWSTTRHAELLAMDEASFCQVVADAGAGQLGRLSLLTKPAAFPLNMQTAERIVRPNLVLIGDAAHQVHPLAGQGVNLGFRDAFVLAKTLAARHAHETLGDPMLLRRYERSRKTDMLAMRHTTHGLHELFGHQTSIVRTLRNWGLGFTNRQHWLKQQLIKQATI